MQAPAPTKRSLPVAVVLGLAAPGLGLWYVGRALWAAAACAVWLLGFVAVSALVMTHDPAGLVAAQRAFFVGVLGVSAAAAGVLALKPAPYKNYMHPWWLVGYALLVWTVSGKARDVIVAQHIGNVVGLPDDHMAPGLARGDLLVVDPRRAPQLGELAVLPTATYPAVLRVVAVGGQRALIDGDQLRINGSTTDESPCGVDEQRAVGLACAAVAIGANRVLVGGTGCVLPPTDIPDDSVLLLPDARTFAHCHAYAQVVKRSTLVGTAVSSRASSANR